MPDISSYCSDYVGREKEYCLAMTKQCEDPSKKFTVDSFDGTTFQSEDIYSCAGYAQFRVTLGIPASFTAGIVARPEAQSPPTTKNEPPKKSTPPNVEEPKIKDEPVVPHTPEPPPAQKKRARNPLEVDVTGNFQPDGIRKLACVCEKVGFEPDRSPDVIITTVGLKFPTEEGVKVLKVSVAYIVEESKAGYTLKYRIFETRTPEKVAKDQLTDEVEFEAGGNFITTKLVFAVITAEPYDINKRGEIKIVALK